MQGVLDTAIAFEIAEYWTNDSKPRYLRTRANLIYAPVHILELLTHSAKPAQPERRLSEMGEKSRWKNACRVSMNILANQMFKYLGMYTDVETNERSRSRSCHAERPRLFVTCEHCCSLTTVLGVVRPYVARARNHIAVQWVRYE